MRATVLRLKFSHWTKTMFENCFQSERVFSCLSNGGMIKSWEQCRKHCESKDMEPFYLAKLIISIRSNDLIRNKLKFLPCFAGYSHVGDIVMLVTYSWWQFKNVGDRFKILVTSFRCWCPTLMLRNRGWWWPKRPKPSLTS